MFVSAVILAAGKSTRFPGNKMLKEITLGGIKAPIIRHTVRKFLNCGGVDEVVVVLGHEKEKIMNVLSDLEVKFVISRNYEEGMSYSVKAGVKAVMKYADVAAIHPGDVPFILPSTLETLLNRASEECGKGKEFIIIPRYKPLNKGGHPLIIGGDLLPYVMDISEEGRGLKSFLNRFRDRIIYIETDDLGVLADIDRPEDLERDKELIERESL